MTAIRNSRLAVAVIRMARRMRLVQSEVDRRHAEMERRRLEAFHGPPLTDEEYAAGVAEVEARRK